MKLNRSVLLAFALLVILGSVSRVLGFAPQIAMALFGGAVIRDKRLAFVLPLLSMFISDLLFQVLYTYGVTEYGGFYDGQITNYILLAGLTCVGFWIKGLNWARIAAGTVAAPAIYFLLSNFLVWFSGGGLHRPMNFSGLMMCYNDAAPFFRSGLANTVVFSVMLFGGYHLLNRYWLDRKSLA